MTSARLLLARSVLLVAAVLVGGGVGYLLGDRIEPSYTSTVLLNSGRLDVQSQAVPGFAEGAKNLASLYSRIATSDAVLDRVAKRRGETVTGLRENISATPVPGDAVFRIEATQPSGGQAQQLVETVSRETMAFVSGLTTGEAREEALLKRYRSLLAEAESYAGRGDRERARLRRQEVTGGSRRLRKFRVDEASARLRAETVASLYTSSRQSSTGSASVTPLNSASAPKSDAAANRQRFGLVGALAGLVLATGVVLLVGSRRRVGSLPTP